jgi:ornithine--oxo-acid transaminase
MSLAINDNATSVSADRHMDLAGNYAAQIYSPLPVVLTEGKGSWVTDIDGNRFLDCLAAYSAVNFGHCNPEIVAAAHEQLDKLTLVSRAFHHDHFGPFCAELSALIGKQVVLPMNTGAEAVETGVKLSRKWGYEVKGVADDQANIIVAGGNFHGRTTTIISFSDDETARAGFGPYTPGFRTVAYGDSAAIAAAIDQNTVAVLVEPIQGEAGVVVPPADYLLQIRELCTRHRVLFIADEIQSGLARTGKTLACEHFGVVPDVYLLGKALGGGVVPVSAVLADRDVMEVLRPGQHGSTFGGNALACAVGRTVVRMLATGEYQERAATLGEHLHGRLRGLIGSGVTAVRGMGLWAGIDIEPALGTGRAVCEGLMTRGVLAKDTHGSTIRLAPPLVIERDEIDWAVDQLAAVLADLG